MKNRGFTLAEIMIVLTVIGILTAIILPSARNLMPDKNLMKFKKAHNTLLTAISELVNSDKYYLDGDLGVKPNGDLIDGTHEGDVTYLCQTLADVLNAKKVNCSEYVNNNSNSTAAGIGISDTFTFDVTIEEKMGAIDYYCRQDALKVGPEIELPDGTVIYQTAPNITFGIKHKSFREQTNEAANITRCQDDDADNPDCAFRMFAGPNQKPLYYDNNGFDIMYKIICVDLDGTPENATDMDAVNESPFGYAIRADGKIFNAYKATKFLEKDIQNNE